ncbi:hypothetical protein H0H92_008590 [Tricholoma furcatifolium]|nr:hypothetical protein H0H92_008590 [Tricholoma furcatifolium]
MYALQAIRIHKENLTESCTVCMLIIAGAVVDIVVSVKVFGLTLYGEFADWKTLAYLMFATAATTDFGIAFVLSRFLIQSRAKMSLRNTHDAWQMLNARDDLRRKLEEPLPKRPSQIPVSISGTPSFKDNIWKRHTDTVIISQESSVKERAEDAQML